VLPAASQVATKGVAGLRLRPVDSCRSRCCCDFANCYNGNRSWGSGAEMAAAGAVEGALYGTGRALTEHAMEPCRPSWGCTCSRWHNCATWGRPRRRPRCYWKGGPEIVCESN